MEGGEEYAAGMDLRACGTCRAMKPVSDYRWRNRARTKRHTQCSDCIRTYKQVWYEKNKEKHVRGVAASRQARLQRYGSELFAYLRERGCMDCGERDPVVLELDHRDGTSKAASVSDLLHRLGASRQRILAEIEKCDVRCANCHRRKTAERGNWYRHLKSVGVV